MKLKQKIIKHNVCFCFDSITQVIVFPNSEAMLNQDAERRVRRTLTITDFIESLKERKFTIPG